MGGLGSLTYPEAVSMPRHERLPAYRVLSHVVVMVAVSAVGPRRPQCSGWSSPSTGRADRLEPVTRGPPRGL